MSDEIQVRSSLFIRKNNLDYQSRPTFFKADMDGEAAAPTPGRITVSTDGTDVDLSLMVIPGVCRIMNIDDTNYITYGIWDPETGVFYPLGEVLPGESYALRLSRALASEYGTGTGTTGPDTNTLRLKADTAVCEAFVEVFEK